MIITIDGPAGTGKGTLAKNLVAKYNYHYLDTGALFRAVGLILTNDGTLNDDNLKMKAEFYAKNLDFEFTKDFKIILDGLDVSNTIRTPQTAIMATKIAAIESVRDILDEFQLTFIKKYNAKGVILDGRDIGISIAPDAQVKIFLDCDAQLRTKRRVKQLAEQGTIVSFKDILDNISIRDHEDRTRLVRPLKAAPDAITIDTGITSPDQVVNIVDACIKKALES